MGRENNSSRQHMVLGFVVFLSFGFGFFLLGYSTSKTNQVSHDHMTLQYLELSLEANDSNRQHLVLCIRTFGDQPRNL
jgi:hypothetical protein